MQGRTNVGSGGGMVLNADIEQFTVAEDNTIIAGDFVEIYDKNIEGMYATDTMYMGLIKNRFYPLGNNVFLRNIMVGGEKNLAIIKYNEDGNIVVLDTLADVGNFEITDNGLLLTTYGLYDISSNTFDVLDTTGITTNNTNTITKIAEPNIYAIIMFYSDKYTIWTYDVSERTLNSKGVLSSITPTGTSLVSGVTLTQALYVDDYVLCGIFNGTSSNRSANRMKIEISMSARTVRQSSYYSAPNSSREDLTENKNCKYYKIGNHICAPASFSSNNYFNVFNFEVIFSENGELKRSETVDLLSDLFSALGVSGTNTLDYAKTTASMLMVKKDVYYGILGTGNKYAIIRVSHNDDNNQIIKSNAIAYEVPYDVTLGAGIMSEDSDGNAFLFYNATSSDVTKKGTYKVALNYDGEKLSLGKAETTVRCYTGKHYPLGVAKDNGVSGNVIDVYIPTV